MDQFNLENGAEKLKLIQSHLYEGLLFLWEFAMGLMQAAQDKYADLSSGSGANYSFKSLPFNEDEEAGIKLVPDSYLDSMDDLNDDDEPGGRRMSETSECEGRVSVLTIDELKNMRNKNKNEDIGLK